MNLIFLQRNRTQDSLREKNQGQSPKMKMHQEKISYIFLVFLK
jgi:hypothetical protein